MTKEPTVNTVKRLFAPIQMEAVLGHELKSPQANVFSGC